MIYGLDMFAQIVVLALCYSAVALTSIWAMLGSGRPVIRSIFVVPIAILGGFVGGYGIDEGADILFWVATSGLQAVFLIGSLCLVRAVGYRFVAKSSFEKM